MEGAGIGAQPSLIAGSRGAGDIISCWGTIGCRVALKTSPDTLGAGFGVTPHRADGARLIIGRQSREESRAEFPMIHLTGQNEARQPVWSAIAEAT